MENIPTLFRFEGKPLNVQADENGDLWFHAGDVCRVLELSNVTMTLRVLDEDEKGLKSIETLGGKQEVNCVTEPGLYKLISRSRKPEAKRFDRWVRHEVLPTIRKTGSYSIERQFDIPKTLSEALRLAADQAEEIEELKHENAALAPKAQIHDKIADSDGLYNLNLSAKAANMPPRQFTSAAHQYGFIFRQGKKWNAYSDKVKAGHCHVKFASYRDRDGEEHFSPQVFFTPKGIQALINRMGMQ
ncbi:BRO family protein [Komagataeibacter xylinus]|uniref:BRO family protein n=1 Tax=Komagataeibacter xylinus TaxID=28448 RepID=UPI00133093A6|nr:phage antirepressor KilAC domain-containing protein [Komagataeibacter xylinus]